MTAGEDERRDTGPDGERDVDDAEPVDGAREEEEEEEEVAAEDAEDAEDAEGLEEHDWSAELLGDEPDPDAAHDGEPPETPLPDDETPPLEAPAPEGPAARTMPHATPPLFAGRPFSIWSPMAADTSAARMPDPDEVRVLPALLLLLAPIAVLGLGAIVAREVVWDGFLDPYIWQPIVMDEGFTLVNTAAWVVLLGLVLLVAVRVTQKIGQRVDFALVLAVVPYILGGSIARVMEDTGYFGEPLRFFFITPIIYVAIFFLAVAWLVIGHFLARQAAAVGHRNALYALAAFLLVVWLTYLGWSHFGGGVARFGHPLVLLVALALPYAYFWSTTRQTGRFSQVGVMATFGTGFFLFTIYMLVLWHVDGGWSAIAPKPNLPLAPVTTYWIYPLMIVAPAIVTAIIAGIAYLAYKNSAGRSEGALAFLLPLNLLVVFAQVKDAILTAIGIDYFGYQEKHVLPGFLISRLEGSGIAFLETYAATLVMIPAKLLVAVLVVWLIDIYARKDLHQSPNLVGLAKLAIIMVGLAPGMRNGIRLALGV